MTVLSIGLSVFLGTIAGYVLSRNRDSFNNKIYAFFLAGMIVPVQIIALVQVLQVVHMMDNYAGLILVYTAMFIPQSVFMVYGFVSTIPKDMDEAAIMDGASPWNLFIKNYDATAKTNYSNFIITQFVFVWK